MLRGVLQIAGATVALFGVFVVLDLVLAPRVSARVRRAAFVLGGVLGMAGSLAFSIEVLPGVVVDARGAVVGCAVLFGGPALGALVAVSGMAFRLVMGGAGAPAGVAGLAVDFALALAATRLSARAGRDWRTSLSPSIATGAAVGLGEALSLAFVPNPRGLAFFAEASPTLALVQLSCTVILAALVRVHDGQRREAGRSRAQEVQLARLNRLHRALSRVAGAVASATDRPSLTQRVCRILVEDGGFAVAWIGRAEAGGAIVAEARHGEDGGYVEGLRLRHDDTPEGRGPAGVAVRSGRTVVTNDFLSADGTAPWHESAARVGLRASVALPLRERGEVSGILSLYAREAGFFRAEEIALAEEVASSVAFAFDGLVREAERKAAEDALRQAQRVARIGSWSWDEVTDRITWSEELRHLYGLRPGAAPPSYEEHLLLYAEESATRLGAAVAATLAGGEPYEIDLELVRPEAAARWVTARGEAVRDAADRIVGLRGTAQDITERKVAEAALRSERASLARRVEERTADLRQANAELARAVRAKDEFLATMSHELRTPLTAILGISESLQEQVFGPLNERQRESIHTVESSGRHLLELINDILDLAKVEAGRLDLRRQPVAIAEACEASVQFVRSAAVRKGVELALSAGDADATLEADPKRLKQILVNLLSNAVKFTPPGGRVSLEVAAGPDDAIRFVVSDTGIGIAAEDMGRLFQPFVQLDSGLSRQHEGTGLGLALVRRFAELHGGSVSVDSEPGRGSRFTVALPYRPDPVGALAPSATATTAGEDPVSPGGRLIVADDSEVNLRTIGDYLRHRGYDVTVARTGREAIDRALESRPDVVVMDIQMPEMDGLAAIRALRADSALCGVPVVALTALAMPGDEEHCLRAGANAYLAKPVRLRDLVTTIERLRAPAAA